MLSATLRLFVLRHGKSDWSTGDPDFDRPLADRGRASAQRVGIWMSEEGLLPDRVISSPARRARDTAELACRMLELKESRIHFDERIYGGSIGELLASLAEHASEAQQVLLVGHNSGLEELVEFLAQEPLAESEDGKVLPTAALAVLRPLTDWQSLGRGSAKLISLTRPGAMRR
ncbi:MAG TPA: histidine phosphatase family protein [Azonexus sp.]|jgi:phosphohistidine phosphatase|nr:histidine phosphatase family protein [Azonexus sp.]